MAELDYSSYVRELLKFVGVRYLWGGSSYKGTDCSGILRAIFGLPFTADDFYKRLYIHEDGALGAVFLVNNATGIAYHVMPLIDSDTNIVLNANAQIGRTRLEIAHTGVTRFI